MLLCVYGLGVSHDPIPAPLTAAFPPVAVCLFFRSSSLSLFTVSTTQSPTSSDKATRRKTHVVRHAICVLCVCLCFVFLSVLEYVVVCAVWSSCVCLPHYTHAHAHMHTAFVLC